MRCNPRSVYRLWLREGLITVVEKVERVIEIYNEYIHRICLEAKYDEIDDDLTTITGRHQRVEQTF